MKITSKKISLRKLSKGYENNDEEGGVWGYNKKLSIRPEYQREYLYKDKKRDAVMDSVMQGFPLNLMYWEDCEDENYRLMDGQQRIISICEYLASKFSINGKFFHNLTKGEKEKILDYELSVEFCVGTEKEILDHIIRINTQGEQMNMQEMRNVAYTGTWLSDARRHFSKRNCPAQDIAGNYLKGSAIHQEYLETAINWRSKGKIEEYMGKNQHKPNANALWSYFQKVIKWTKITFPNYRKVMKGIPLGALYDEFKNKQLDSSELEIEVTKLMQDEDIDNKKGIYEYVLTRNEKHLNLRAFSDAKKIEAYERQKGICPVCNKPFERDEMEADHIMPWSKGGKTTSENCQMLCKHDNRTKSGK